MKTAAPEIRTYDCPLCSRQFGGNGESCHSACPMSPACRMIKCPHCNYEFVEDSSIVNFFRKLFTKKQEPVEVERRIS